MAIVRKGMHVNPNLVIYAGSPQFEPQGGTIISGDYAGVFAAPARRNPNWQAYHTQHGAGRFVSFADDFAGDEKGGVMGALVAMGQLTIVAAIALTAMVLLPKGD